MAKRKSSFVVYQNSDEIYITTPENESQLLAEVFDTADTYPRIGRLTWDEYEKLEKLDEERWGEVDERLDVFDRGEIDETYVSIGVSVDLRVD